MREFSQNTRIKESPDKYPVQKEMMRELMGDHEEVIKLLRKDIEECGQNYKDAGTADFLTGIMEKHESTAWILRRYLM
jgi:starvation-inducible DNA-binding protein